MLLVVFVIDVSLSAVEKALESGALVHFLDDGMELFQCSERSSAVSATAGRICGETRLANNLLASGAVFCANGDELAVRAGVA